MSRIKQRLVIFLQWSQKYTKTDMVYLAHGGFWLGIAQIAASAAGFLITIVLANLLAPETLGEYRFLLAGFAFLSIAALPGMRSAVRESTPKGHLANLSLAFRTMMRWGVLGSIAALGIAIYYFIQENIGLAIGFTVIALSLPFFDSSSIYIEYLNSLKKFNLSTLYVVITRIILLAVTVAAAIIYPQHAWLILAAFFLGQIVPNILFHHKTEREFVVEGAKSDSTLTHYAKHLTAMTALGLIAGQLDKMFVWEFIGAGGLAVLYIAYVIPQETSRFLGLMSALAFPKFAVADPKIIKKTLPGKLFKYFLVVASIVVTYILLAPFIFSLLFPQYTSAVMYSQVLMFGVLARTFAPIRTFLTTQKATKALYVLSIIPPAARILAAIILIIPFGLWGAVTALLIEALMRSTILLILFYRVRV